MDWRFGEQRAEDKAVPGCAMNSTGLVLPGSERLGSSQVHKEM